jgi:hypothetical protein
MAEPIYPDFVNAFARGREIGREIRQTKITDNALAKFSAGDRTGGINELMTVDPSRAAALQTYDQGQQDRDLGRRVGGMAASGDLTGARRTALEGGGFEIAEGLGKLDAQQRAVAAERASTLGAIGIRLLEVPYGQRKGAIESLLPALAERGFDPEQIAGLDPTDANLNGAIGQAMTIKDAIAAQDQERERAERERHNRATESRPIIVGGGAVAVDGEGGGVIYRNPKTFAPPRARAGGIPPLPPGARLVP